MKKILDFFKSVRSEWFKIVWPSRDSVIRATIMILVFSGLATLFFFVVDSVLNAIVGWIFSKKRTKEVCYGRKNAVVCRKCSYGL